MGCGVKRILPLLACLLAVAGCSGGGETYNVVLISVDTLRADRLNCYGYSDHTVSPNIDDLARDGVLFENFITSSPWTTPAHVSMLTGMHPSSHGMIQAFTEMMKELGTPKFNSLPDRRWTLAEALREQGYSTAAFTGGITLDPKIGFEQGFELYDTSMYKLNDENMGAMLDWLDAHSTKPFFLFWHNFEVHAPYLHTDFLPPEYARIEADYKALGRTMDSGKSLTGHTRNLSAVKKFLQRRDAFNLTVCDALYAGGILSMDRWLGRLVDELRSRGLYDRTMIVFTSDHGEEFADHDPTRFHDYHGHSAFEEIVRVPLIIKLPGQRHAGSRVEGVASMIDLMPTILDVLGASPAQSEMQGVSLKASWEASSSTPPRIAFSEASARSKEVKSVRTDRHKYIVEIAPEVVSRHGRSHVPDEPGLRMMFDLVEDPREKSNLLVQADARTAELGSRLEQQLRAFVAAQPGETEEIVLDPETLEKLKALGYVD